VSWLILLICAYVELVGLIYADFFCGLYFILVLSSPANAAT
jgi:hypothetical protein